MIVLIFIWVLFGIVTAIVFQNKGLGGCAGFLLGFLLGPFGLIIALVMSPNQQQMESNAVANGEMRKCPDCAEIIRAEARKCRFCGSIFVDETAPPQP